MGSGTRTSRASWWCRVWEETTRIESSTESRSYTKLEVFGVVMDDTFDCIRDISIFALGNVTNVDVLLWMHDHHVCSDVKCKKCDGVVEVTCNSGEFRKVCGECGSRGRGFYSGWFSRTNWCQSLRWVFSGLLSPECHSSLQSSMQRGAGGVGLVGFEVWVRCLLKPTDESDVRSPFSWATSQWDEVCFAQRTVGGFRSKMCCRLSV